MREILFRGKRTDGKGWLYGYYSFNPTTNIHWIRTPRTTYWDEDMVDPSTVGQYTGLKDKDGKRIFEGDIVVFSRGRNLPNTECLPELIKYHQGDCAYQRYPLGRCLTRAGAGRLIQPDMMISCEVVGNVHDNPELLEGGDE